MTIVSHAKPEPPAEPTALVPVQPPSERYGADTTVSPWSRVIDFVLGLILAGAAVEEFVDFCNSEEVLHLLVFVGLGVVLFGYVIRVGTRDL